MEGKRYKKTLYKLALYTLAVVYFKIELETLLIYKIFIIINLNCLSLKLEKMLKCTHVKSEKSARHLNRQLNWKRV